MFPAQPLISVLLPVHNGEAFLEQALESVLGQTCADFELVVVNDGSTDRSKHIIFSYADRRIRYVENEGNLGLVATLNKGIALCKGRYIARMDADDVCEPRRLERQVRYMEAHPEVGVCGTWARVIDASGRVTGRIVNQTDPVMVSVALLFTVPVLHPSAMVRADLLRGHPYRDVPQAEDYDLWCRLDRVTRIANLPFYLMRYRWHGGNVSQERQERQRQSTYGVIRGQLVALGLDPDEGTLALHRLSFFLYGHGGGAAVAPSELAASEKWFGELFAANAAAGRYDPDRLCAYLWSRMLVLSRASAVKRRFPRFASLRPRVLRLLFQQLRLLARK